MDKNQADELINSINLNEPVRLILGYRSQDKVSLSRVPLAQSAQDLFEDIAKRFLKNCLGREPEDWDPSRPVSKETYLVTTPTEVGNVPQVASSDIQPLIRSLLYSDTIAEASSSTLRKTEPSFYAFQFGSGNDSAVFLRKLNALRGLKKKKIAILSDELHATEQRIFAFDDSSDLILTSGTVLVFSQTAFAYLFRGQADLEKMTREWLYGIEKSTPMAEGSAEILLKRTKSDSRIAKRVESISRRGHLAHLTSADLRKGMSKCDLNPKELLNDHGELIFTESNAGELLKFLNEDMFRGVMTDDPFEVDSKAPRSL